MDKLTKEAVALARALGFTVETGKKHLKIVSSSGKLVTIVPRRASNKGRNMNNYRAALLRAAREEERR